MRRKRKSKISAPAAVLFTTAFDRDGNRKPCVYAQCQYAGVKAGPIWGHGDNSVRRCLATLTRSCQCGRRYHRARGFEGRRRGDSRAFSVCADWHAPCPVIRSLPRWY